MLKINFFREREILERIKTNDRTVLGELFIKYERLIFSYIKTHGGSSADAEDILQEAIIVLWQKVNSGSFQLSAKLGTFLLAVAKNKWMSQMRRQKRLAGNELPDDVNDGNPSSLDRLMQEEKVEILRKALNIIQPLCKKILMLFYFEGRNLEDIAKILQFANVSVAKSKKYQCKKSLEAVLKNKIPETERRI